jgi:hypothetical protein
MSSCKIAKKSFTNGNTGSFGYMNKNTFVIIEAMSGIIITGVIFFFPPVDE